MTPFLRKTQHTSNRNNTVNTQSSFISMGQRGRRPCSDSSHVTAPYKLLFYYYYYYYYYY